MSDKYIINYLDFKLSVLKCKIQSVSFSNYYKWLMYRCQIDLLEDIIEDIENNSYDIDFKIKNLETEGDYDVLS